MVKQANGENEISLCFCMSDYEIHFRSLIKLLSSDELTRYIYILTLCLKAREVKSMCFKETVNHRNSLQVSIPSVTVGKISTKEPALEIFILLS